jgi:two-component system response regulator YesN
MPPRFIKKKRVKKIIMRKVTIIDDNPIVVTSLAQTIKWERLGCELNGVAYNGDEGYSLIIESRPDIVVTDIRMPGLDGLTLTQRLADFEPSPIVIIITSYADFQYAKRSLQLGVFDYIVKPIDNDSFEEVIKNAVIRLNETDQKAHERIVTLLEEGSDMQVIKRFLLQRIGNTRQNEERRYSHIIAKAVQFMNSRSSSKLSLKEIADHVQLSPNYFSALFKKEVGKTLSEFLIEAKMDKAKLLLINPQYKVYEVGSMVGYSLDYF